MQIKCHLFFKKLSNVPEFPHFSGELEKTKICYMLKRPEISQRKLSTFQKTKIWKIVSENFWKIVSENDFSERKKLEVRKTLELEQNPF